MHAPSLPIELDLDRPHVARVNNYLAGGCTNFSADRSLADAALAVHPRLWTAARDAALFTRRAVGHLARAGVRQFVDLAQGVPLEDRAVHDVAHAVDATCRVIYVEDDPVVHALQSALSSTDTGLVACVRASPLLPEGIWGHGRVCGMFDLTEPVAVVVGALLQHLPYRYGPRGVLHCLTAGLPTGSHVVMTHLSGDTGLHSRTAAVARVYRIHGIPLRPRTRHEILALVPGTPIAPGLVPAARWHADPRSPAAEEAVACYAAVSELDASTPARRIGT
ncbi:SAM-dependent methyltransferase [Embleya sp. NPDC127516]|uniref:SAM-dependent methyltransferase n=1 Tax=Embleya sp. NPDC127516 TaxID=3363990 RepID=UPI003811A53B